jgi:hypothetical protein
MAQTQNSTSKTLNNYLMLITLIVLGLSVVALFSSIYAMSIGQDLIATFMVAIGLLALALSGSLLYQTRKRTATMKTEAPKVMTIIECKKCGAKTTREHQRGDFVFKTLEVCPKCPEEKQMITGIYKEIKEKEKTYAV